MGNCCRSPAAVAREDVRSHFPGTARRPDSRSAAAAAPSKRLSVLTSGSFDPNAGGIEDSYLVDRELGRGEFGVTYLCVDRASRELLACKSISKRKLRTAVDVEDVRREVAIMRHLPRNPSIVALREAREDDSAVHLVMELCEGGELFDRIVARGHYTERAAAGVTRTIIEVVQLCHQHGVIHRDLKPENFLFANKKENSPLKAIDFGLSIFFKPATGGTYLSMGTPSSPINKSLDVQIPLLSRDRPLAERVKWLAMCNAAFRYVSAGMVTDIIAMEGENERLLLAQQHAQQERDFLRAELEKAKAEGESLAVRIDEMAAERDAAKADLAAKAEEHDDYEVDLEGRMRDLLGLYHEKVTENIALQAKKDALLAVSNPPVPKNL